MKKSLHSTFVVIAVAWLAAPILPAAIPVFDQLVPAGSPNLATTITLRTATLQTVAPQPAYIANINPGAALNLAVSMPAGSIRSIQWIKNDAVLPITVPILQIPAATAADSGIYKAVVTTNSSTTALFEQVTIRVEAPQRMRALNISTLATLSASQRTFTSGFVLSSAAGSLKETKTLLIRAVGPTLSNYGVGDALADPDVHVYDATGNEVISSPLAATYGDLFKDVPAKVGAFPLPVGSKDRFFIYQLPGGVYSARVSSLSGGNGTVLLEIYDVLE